MRPLALPKTMEGVLGERHIFDVHGIACISISQGGGNAHFGTGLSPQDRDKRKTGTKEPGQAQDRDKRKTGISKRQAQLEVAPL